MAQAEQGDSREATSDAGRREQRGALGAKEENFAGVDPDRNQCRDQGGDAGGNTRFSPEQACVEAGEHDEAEQRSVEELARP